MEENNNNPNGATKMNTTNGTFDGSTYSVAADGFITVTEGEISLTLSGSKFVAVNIDAIRRSGEAVSAWTANRIFYVFCLAERAMA